MLECVTRAVARNPMHLHTHLTMHFSHALKHALTHALKYALKHALTHALTHALASGTYAARVTPKSSGGSGGSGWINTTSRSYGRINRPFWAGHTPLEVVRREKEREEYRRSLGAEHRDRDRYRQNSYDTFTHLFVLITTRSIIYLYSCMCT